MLVRLRGLEYKNTIKWMHYNIGDTCRYSEILFLTSLISVIWFWQCSNLSRFNFLIRVWCQAYTFCVNIGCFCAWKYDLRNLPVCHLLLAQSFKTHRRYFRVSILGKLSYVPRWPILTFQSLRFVDKVVPRTCIYFLDADGLAAFPKYTRNLG